MAALTSDVVIESKKWLCNRCIQPIEGVKSVDIKITDKLRKPVMQVPYAGLVLFSNELIDKIGVSQINSYCYLGNVINSKNNINDKYKTLRGMYQITIRGDKTSIVQECPDCKRPMYFAKGQLYLYGIPKGIPIFESINQQTIIVSEEIYLKLVKKNVPQLVAKKLVLKENLEDEMQGYPSYITI